MAPAKLKKSAEKQADDNICTEPPTFDLWLSENAGRLTSTSQEILSRERNGTLN